MSQAAPISREPPVERQEDLWWQACSYLSMALDRAAQVPDGDRAIGEALCGALDTVGAGAPRYEAFGDLRDSAEWWADCATPAELELYTGAALRRIERTPFAPRARKRLFLALWETMTRDDQLAFLTRVDPGGKFIGGKG